MLCGKVRKSGLLVNKKEGEERNTGDAGKARI